MIASHPSIAFPGVPANLGAPFTKSVRGRFHVRDDRVRSSRLSPASWPVSDTGCWFILPRKRLRQQAASHSYPPMNLPHGQISASWRGTAWALS